MTASSIATIDAISVDPAGAEWNVVDDNGFVAIALLAARDFEPGGRIEFLLPRRALPADWSAEDVTISVGPYETMRWATYADHMKAFGVFARKPAALQQWFAVNLVDLDADVVDGGVDLLHDGRIVGRLPRPFLLDAAGERHELAWELDGGALTCELPDLDPALYVGAVFDPTTVVATTGVGTPYANARHLRHSANGNRWVSIAASSGVVFFYSTDRGASWTEHAAAAIAGAHGATDFFIDASGFAHFAWRQVGTGGGRDNNRIYYVRGTFNAGQTTITWSTPEPMSGVSHDFPSLVAHVEGTGWAVHLLSSQGDPSTANVRHTRITVSSGGVIAVAANTNIGVNAGNSQLTYPVLDFNHTGDGKTVAGATPHLYVAFRLAATGSGKGVRWKKATYSAGSWTWGTDRALDESNDAASGRICGYFDGTRFVTAYVPSTALTTVEVKERDAADTTTTDRNPPALSDGNVAAISATFDSLGNIYLFAVGGTSLDPKWVKYTRATDTWGSWSSALEATTVQNDTLSAKHGYTDGRIEVVYTKNAAAPYDIRHEVAVVLNAAPTAPAWSTSAGAKDVAATLALAAPFADPDPGDTPSAYALRRDIGGTVRWWDGTDWDATTLTWVTSSDQSWTIPAGWGADGDADHSYYVAYKDAAGAGDPPVYSAALVITPSAKVNPAIDTPAHLATVTSSSLTAAWTVAQQTERKIRLLSAADVELWSSGWEVYTDRLRTVPYTLVNGTTYKLEVTTKNNEGLESLPDTNTFPVSFTGPATPTFTLDDSDNLKVVIDIDNPLAGNLLTANQASIETDTTGWAASANCSIARSTAQAADGSASLALTATAAATMKANTLTGLAAVPVTAGATYTALASFRAATAGRSSRVAIKWYDAAGVLLSTSEGVAAGSDTVSWLALSVTAAAPVNAAFAAAELQVGTASSPAIGEVHYADKISLAAGSSTTWALPLPAASENRVHRRVTGDTGDGIRIAAGIAEDGSYTDPYVGSREDFDYRIEAVGANGTSTFSAWQSA